MRCALGGIAPCCPVIICPCWLGIPGAMPCWPWPIWPARCWTIIRYCVCWIGGSLSRCCAIPGVREKYCFSSAHVLISAGAL